MAVDFFTNYILPPVILLLGLFGNTMGIVVVSRKNLKNIGPVLIYKFLFISDSIYLSILLFKFLKLIYIFNIKIFSPDNTSIHAGCIQL
jgi:hypothetical protein